MTHGDKLRLALEFEIDNNKLARMLERYCPKHEKINCDYYCLDCWEKWLESEVND